MSRSPNTTGHSLHLTACGADQRTHIAFIRETLQWLGRRRQLSMSAQAIGILRRGCQAMLMHAVRHGSDADMPATLRAQAVPWDRG